MGIRDRREHSLVALAEQLASAWTVPALGSTKQIASAVPSWRQDWPFGVLSRFSLPCRAAFGPVARVVVLPAATSAGDSTGDGPEAAEGAAAVAGTAPVEEESHKHRGLDSKLLGRRCPETELPAEGASAAELEGAAAAAAAQLALAVSAPRRFGASTPPGAAWRSASSWSAGGRLILILFPIPR